MRKIISKIKEASFKHLSQRYISAMEPLKANSENYLQLYFKTLVVIFKQVYSLDLHIFIMLNIAKVLSFPNILILYFIYNFFNNIHFHGNSSSHFMKRNRIYIIYAMMNYVYNWIYKISYLILAFNCILKPNYIEILIIKQKKEVSLANVSLFTFKTSLENCLNIFKVLLILVHLSNPVSFSRIKHMLNRGASLKFMIHSYLLIYLQDCFILFIIIFNSFFVFSAVDFYRELISMYYQSFVKFTMSDPTNLSINQSVRNCHLYLHLKNSTFKLCKENLFYTFYISLFFINFPFFWKYNNLFDIFKCKFKIGEFVFYDLIINFIDGILDLVSPFFYLINILLGDNSITYYFKSKYKLKPLTHNYNLFHISYLVFKIFDLIVTIISFFRIACFTFYIFYMRWLFAKNKRTKIFPLFQDEKILKLIEIKKITNLYYELDEMEFLFKERRKKIFFIVLTEFVENLYFILSFLTMINPFYIIIYIRTVMMLYFKTIMRAENSHIKIVKKIKCIQITIFKNFLYDTFFVLPLLIIFCIVSPWNSFSLFKHIFKYYIRTPFKEISKSFRLFKIREEIYCNISYCKVLKNENERFLFKMREKIPKEWIFLFRLITINFSIYRSILFWKDLIFLYKYKKDRIKSVTKSYNFEQISPQSRNSTILNFARFRSTTLKDTHLDSEISNDLNDTQNKLKSKKQLLRRFSLNTLKFVNESNIKLLKGNLYRHYQHIQNEIIFYPFLILISILTPWNIKKFTEIFKSLYLKDKYIHFKYVFYIFLSDIVTFFAVIFLLFSFVKTIDTIVLIYYSFKKNLLRQSQFKIYYDLEYKSNFKGQIKEMMKGLFSNFSIFCLILLNIFLLTRIKYLANRISYYLKSKIKNDISKFKHLMKIHLSKGNYQIHPFLNEKTIPQISVFLTPQSVFNFSCANSYFLSLLNMNVVWKNLFTNFYNKKLAQHNCVDFVNPIVFENYKTLCRELTAYLSSNKEKRDQIIGVLQILMEETIESFLNIPHLILFPYKIISYFLFEIRKQMNSIFKQIYKLDFFEINKQIFLKINHDKITEWIEFSNLDSFYYNIQLIGFMSLFDLILIQIEFFTNLIVFLHYSIIMALNRSNTRILQILDLIIFFSFHFLLILLPIAISSGCFEATNHFKYFDDLDRCTAFSYFENISKMTGANGINFIFIFLNLYYISYIDMILSKTSCKLYSYLKYVFDPREMLVDIISSIPNFLFYSLFPQILIRSYILKTFSSSLSFKSYLISKVTLIFLYIFPFVLNFIITNSILRLIIINSYGLFSIIILIIINIE
jgi:hypothetical protein